MGDKNLAKLAKTLLALGKEVVWTLPLLAEFDGVTDPDAEELEPKAPLFDWAYPP